jgi:hypothetical protein
MKTVIQNEVMPWELPKILPTVPILFGIECALEPGQRTWHQIYPQQLFRGMWLYFDATPDVVLNEVRVGNCHQLIQNVPTTFFNEREKEDSMKGRSVQLDTAEAGNVITFELTSLNPHFVTILGCLEGVGLR